MRLDWYNCIGKVSDKSDAITRYLITLNYSKFLNFDVYKGLAFRNCVLKILFSKTLSVWNFSCEMFQRYLRIGYAE